MTKRCVICDAKFEAKPRVITCSPDCRAENRRRKRLEYDAGYRATNAEAIKQKRKSDPERARRRSAELREMIREVAENMALVGMDRVTGIPPEHIERRRIWDRFSDRRSLTGIILGDPIPERSALGREMAG
jgi:hypothetical protein